jgi:capsular exopolysaccharide synthesis family protein
MDYGIQANVWAKVRVQINRYIGAIRRIWWLLPLTISVGLFIAAWVVAQMPPAYESSAKMIYAGEFQLEGAAYSEQLSNYFGTQIQLMQSDQVKQDAIAQVQAMHPDWKQEDVDYHVSQVPSASMFILEATAQSARYAQAYLDAAMDAYIGEKRRLREDVSDNTTVGLNKEMGFLDQKIEKDEADMLDFQKKNNTGFLEQEGNSAAKYMEQLNQQLAALQSNYNLLSMLDLDQNLDRQQNQASPNSDPTAPGNDAKADTALTSYGPIADYQKARQQVALLKSQLEDMSHRLKPKHPDIIALNLEIQRQEDLISTLRVQSQEALKTHREDIGLQIQNLQNEIKLQQAKALDLSGPLAEYNRLVAKSNRDKAEYDQMMANFHTVDATKTVDQDPLAVLTHASPAVSVKPGLGKIFLAGFGGGLLVGLLILFIIDQQDDRISSLMELQTHFPEHLLGQIPQEKLDAGGALLRSDDDRQALLESFRTLRSSIMFLPVEGKRPKTIVVTSALPDEGKTTVASNLAVTLAFSGAKTLIVDADLRRGQVSRVFGATQCNGFSNILLQKLTWRESVYTTSTENLFILPCGPALPHTSEHLLGKVTDQFLLDVYDQFDYVIFDSPPVIIIDDTLCLAPKIDATIFVVRFNGSSVRSSRRALDLLEARQVNVIGLVCNGVTLSETEYNYNYNYRQYGNRYAEVKADKNDGQITNAKA